MCGEGGKGERHMMGVTNLGGPSVPPSRTLHYGLFLTSYLCKAIISFSPVIRLLHLLPIHTPFDSPLHAQ